MQGKGEQDMNRSNKTQFIYCICCGKEFQRYKRPKYKQLGKGIRRSASNTCSPICARRIQYERRCKAILQPKGRRYVRLS